MCKKGQNTPSPIPPNRNAGNPQSRNQSQSSSSGGKPEDVLTSSELTLSCYSFRSSQEIKTPSPETITAAKVTTVTSSGEIIQNPSPPTLGELPLQQRRRAEETFVTTHFGGSPVIDAAKIRDSFYCHQGTEEELSKLVVTSQKSPSVVTSCDKPEDLV